jgi:hypothetical protein
MNKRTVTLRKADSLDSSGKGRPAEKSIPSARDERTGATIVMLADEGDRLLITGPDGRTELAVRLTSQGPVVELRGASLELLDTRRVALKCQSFEVEATDKIVMQSHGTWEQKAKEVRIEASGRVEVEARGVAIEARLGSVNVKANDDVIIDGERIFLNR